ncbi:MAG: ThiF family adenylyltransferase [Planctomycetaceae bacterium]|nr:ThiF family adenylyltransferase [Planctomycetaceae bacterium]
MLFSEIGSTGQQRIQQSRITLIGCGALGCVLADSMTRAGVGFIRLIDRDFVEMTNLQRQVLFTEQDVADHLPKSICAARRLQQVNSEIEIEPVVADVDYRNIRPLIEGADLILDGTDNFEIRYLINDISLDTGIPWIFTGCTGSYGQMMPVFPGRSACLRCLIPEPPPPGATETCDTAGVLGPAIGTIASLQAAMALRILTTAATEVSGRGLMQAIEPKLTMVDVWDGTFRQIDVSQLRDSAECPACKRGDRPWLSGSRGSGSQILCGRNAVQISPPEPMQLSLTDLASRLQSSGVVTTNPFLARIHLAESGMEMTVFPDGRAIIKGTEDPLVARSLYSRYIGT